MKIFLNDEEMPFELENEQNAYDIVKELLDYLSSLEPKHFIVKLSIDGKEYSLADSVELSKLDVGNIGQIYIETNDVFGITTLSMQQIENFLSLLLEILRNKEWDDALIGINDTLDWMREGVCHIISLFSSDEDELKKLEGNFIDNLVLVSDIFKTLDSENFSSMNEQIEKLIEYVTKMNDSLLDMKRNLASSYKILDKDFILDDIDKILGDIDEVMPKLENVPLLFQTGEDQESMNIIQKLTEILEKSINLFVLFRERFKLYMDKYVVKEVSFEEFFKALTDNLRELMEAIKNNDSVMIGDLLEYEFVPNIGEIKSILSRIRAEAFTKAN